MIVGAAVLFGIGLVFGFALGRTDDEEAAQIPNPEHPDDDGRAVLGRRHARAG